MPKRRKPTPKTRKKTTVRRPTHSNGGHPKSKRH